MHVVLAFFVPFAFHAEGRKIFSSGTLCMLTGMRSMEHMVIRSAPICPVADSTVVGAPVIHYIISRCKCALSCGTGSKPCAGPCIVGTFPKLVGNLIRQLHCPAFCNLKHRPETLTRFRRIMVTGISGLGKESEEYPPPLK